MPRNVSSSVKELFHRPLLILPNWDTVAGDFKFDATSALENFSSSTTCPRTPLFKIYALFFLLTTISLCSHLSSSCPPSSPLLRPTTSLSTPRPVVRSSVTVSLYSAVCYSSLRSFSRPPADTAAYRWLRECGQQPQRFPVDGRTHPHQGRTWWPHELVVLPVV